MAVPAETRSLVVEEQTSYDSTSPIGELQALQMRDCSIDTQPASAREDTQNASNDGQTSGKLEKLVINVKNELPACIDCYLLVVLKFTLGVWEPTCGIKQWLSCLVPIFLLLWSIATVSIYLVCYFGRANHLLIFLSFLSYWLSVMSPEIICSFAIFKNIWIQKCSDAMIREDVHGVRVFNVTYISNHLRVHKTVAFIYAFFGFPLLVARIAYFVKLLKKCRRLYDIFWMVNDCFNACFYTLFCYFLCLQRVALEKEGRVSSKYIRDNLGNLDDCKTKVVTFFKQYKRLRQVVIPWIWMILFFSSCGLTAVFTWNYNSVPDPPSSPPTAQPCTSWCCNVTCDKVPLLIANEHYRKFSNATVMLRNILIAGFALIALNGSDLKHVWDTFRLRLFTIYSAQNKTKLEELIQFMDGMHTESAPDSLGIVFSIAGILIGILGSENFR